MNEHRDAPSADGGPPLPLVGVDVLADLHADALDVAATAAVTALLAHDADARAVLLALDATVAELAGLRLGPVAVPVPVHVAARLDSALALLSANPWPRPAPYVLPTSPVLDHAVTRLAVTRHADKGRRRLLGAGALAMAAAVAGVVLVGGVLGGASTTSGTAVTAALDLGSGQLGGALLASLGRTDLGPLRDPATLAACLAANGVAEGTPLLGSAQVLLRGEPGTLLLLTTGTAGSFTALVVGPACSATDPAQLARQRIGTR